MFQERELGWERKMEEERRGDWGNLTSGFQSNLSDCCESLCCRISFISYWCYFVLSRLPSTCNGNLGALRRGRVFVWSVWRYVCLYSSCFRQYLYNWPQLHPLRSLSASTNIRSARDLEANLLKCVSRNFPLSVGDTLYFLICVLLQPLLNVTGACTAIYWTIC